jgi:(S)-2-hydroxyglutarate dehydrogenase
MTSATPNPDFLIVGAGIIGTAVARELKSRYPDQKILVVDKEAGPAAHASGRNSGVLHAGFYYSTDSLKASFTRLGQQMMKEFILTEGLRYNPCGKLVVARTTDDIPGLEALMNRAQANQVDLRWVNELEMREIEPRAVSCGDRALFSPSTASADPLEVLGRLQGRGRESGIEFRFGERYVKPIGDGTHQLAGGKVRAGFLINAAGLYADVIARQHGAGAKYRIVPYKGIYLYAGSDREKLRTHIYPVPNLRNPFLGVHFTLTVDGRVKIGPTAIPALWREQYEGVKGFSAVEFADVLWRNLGLMVSGKNSFFHLAASEVQNLSRRRLAGRAGRMLRDFDPAVYKHWGRPGIRAQLVDIQTRSLVTDFVLEKAGKSLHILNAVSPGWTSSLAFAKFVADKID